MALQSYTNDLRTIRDILALENTPWSRKTVKITPLVDVSPGSVLDASGALVSSDSTEAFLSLEYASANTETNLLVAASHVYIKDFNLIADDVSKAKELLAINDTVRFAGAPDLIVT
ncbi:hypothetical protein [Pantoea sp. Taur]|uniref:hypothetical protein n=1 Tax=Pantoea sp. Taur TaxID=2576757 RepID=UPI0013527991|nr:hypothetical protein [Pantoea sp. Taur]MXP59551.1 hypothetical protein [Pantoea sp. Taur]